MKKVFKLENLDCANCAAKMEKEINKIEDVEEATVNFMMQKLTIFADEDKFQTILKDAEKAIKKVNRHCSIKG